ncbi:hypothetical protein LNQ52_28115 [Klebsiella pneumoniae subsp. pneumoniae]|nr:hypothetical protein [Klebsiella pneumoniae subsp. pneumoniae]
MKFSAVRQPRAMVPARRAGVVNIITKRPTNTWHGSLSFFTNQPGKQQRRHDQSR